MADVNQRDSPSRIRVNKHLWARFDYPDRTVWILSLILDVRSREIGFCQGLITATLEEVPQHTAFLLLGVAVHY
jgi:hypothetical protein